MMKPLDEIRPGDVVRYDRLWTPPSELKVTTIYHTETHVEIGLEDGNIIAGIHGPASGIEVVRERA